MPPRTLEEARSQPGRREQIEQITNLIEANDIKDFEALPGGVPLVPAIDRDHRGQQTGRPKAPRHKHVSAARAS